MSVYNLLNAALYSRLSGTALTALLSGGTATPSVYFQQAPDEAALPYVVFSYQAGPTEPQRSPHRDPEALVYVRAYAADAPGISGAAQAGTIDAAVDTLLHMRPLVIAGYTNYWIGRGQSISNVEIDSAQTKTWTAGALWDIRLDKAP